MQRKQLVLLVWEEALELVLHVIARAAREMNILTVGNNLTIRIWGSKRMRRAVAGLEELKKHLDTTISFLIKPSKIANETGFEESLVYRMMFWNMVFKHYRPNGETRNDKFRFADVETVMSSSESNDGHWRSWWRK